MSLLQASLVNSQTFDSSGPTDAPAIVLIHGSVVTRKIWLPQLRGLSDTFHVIAPDLPGHGALADSPFTFSSAVEILADVIRQQGNNRALVAGLSLGGYVAMELARCSPGLVAGLVLSGCSLNFEGILGSYLKFAGQLMQRGWIKLGREKSEARVRRMFPPTLTDVAEEQIRAGVYPDALAPSYMEMAHKDFSAVLAEYPGPTLILNGEKDAATRKGEANCTNCHNGPLFTNNDFHNTGVPAAKDLPDDVGRSLGAQQVLADEFNCLSVYSDAHPDECAELNFLVIDEHQQERQYKPPSLRNVAQRGPFMHAGQFAALEEVLNHYNTAPQAPAGHSELEPLNLTEKQIAQIIAFLKTLDGPIDADPNWLTAPQ